MCIGAWDQTVNTAHGDTPWVRFKISRTNPVAYFKLFYLNDGEIT